MRVPIWRSPFNTPNLAHLFCSVNASFLLHFIFVYANVGASKEMDMTKVAYLHKASGGGYTLTICDRPCNGDEFANSEKMHVIGKREARKVCEALDATSYNF
jgi:hypothetical protein